MTMEDGLAHINRITNAKIALESALEIISYAQKHKLLEEKKVKRAVDDSLKKIKVSLAQLKGDCK